MPIRSAYSVFYFPKDLKVCMYYWEVECAHLCVSVFRYLCEVCVLPHLNPLVEESHVGEKCMWCFWKNKCGHWRIKKRKKWIDQGEEKCTMKEKEKQGGAFPAGKLIRDHFPNFILFLPSLFLSLHLFCFFYGLDSFNSHSETFQCTDDCSRAIKAQIWERMIRRFI